MKKLQVLAVSVVLVALIFVSCEKYEINDPYPNKGKTDTVYVNNGNNNNNNNNGVVDYDCMLVNITSNGVINGYPNYSYTLRINLNKFKVQGIPVSQSDVFSVTRIHGGVDTEINQDNAPMFFLNNIGTFINDGYFEISATCRVRGPGQEEPLQFNLVNKSKGNCWALAVHLSTDDKKTNHNCIRFCSDRIEILDRRNGTGTPLHVDNSPKIATLYVGNKWSL